MHRIVAPVFVLLLQSSFLHPASGSERQWLCSRYSGKGNHTLVIQQAHTLKWFAEQLPEFDQEIAWRVGNEPGWKIIKAEIDPVGEFGGREVDDVLYRIAGKPDPVAKLVLIGNRRQFRPVVWTLADFNVRFMRSTVSSVSGTAVLINRDEVAGTGSGTYEDYFVFDDASELPVRLGFDALIASEVKMILPPGTAVLKGGGFAIQSLTYQQGVWKDGDPNCCPTGGHVEIRFAIRGNAPEVISAAYDQTK
jgi:hypothetical protein